MAVRSRSRRASDTKVPGKLAKYRSMCDFSKTAEPSGVRLPHALNSFVVQQHAERRLHYDFRFELDHVLLSCTWGIADVDEAIDAAAWRAVGGKPR